MQRSNLKPTLEHLYDNVKPDINSQLPLFSDSVIHHKVTTPRIVGNTLKDIEKQGKRYGVSSSYKILTRELLIKKFDKIRDALANVCNLTTKEREVVLVLLRLYAYYPQVYPKASQVAEAANVSIATFWRTVDKLQDMNLLEVANRFLIRVEAQISNLYLLKGLIILIAKYLAERIAHIWPDWIMPALKTPWPEFWSFLEGDQLKLPIRSFYSHTAL